jgi:hypothetical protein
MRIRKWYKVCVCKETSEPDWLFPQKFCSIYRGNRIGS